MKTVLWIGIVVMPSPVQIRLFFDTDQNPEPTLKLGQGINGIEYTIGLQ
jgi:hypothetical protein